jgi:hypothetical protein
MLAASPEKAAKTVNGEAGALVTYPNRDHHISANSTVK